MPPITIAVHIGQIHILLLKKKHENIQKILNKVVIEFFFLYQQIKVVKIYTARIWSTAAYVCDLFDMVTQHNTPSHQHIWLVILEFKKIKRSSSCNKCIFIQVLMFQILVWLSLYHVHYQIVSSHPMCWFPWILR